MGPDTLRNMFPPEMLERLGLMHAWAFRMVLASLGRQPDALAEYATRIATYDDRPDLSIYAGAWPGTRFTFSVEQVMQLVSDLLDIAHDPRSHGTGDDLFTNVEVLDGTRSLINELVPADHLDAALAVADQMPATATLGRWPLERNKAQIGELYFVTALAAWLLDQPMVSRSRYAARRMLLQKIHEVEATARGVPEAERVDVTEQEALNLLDSVLGSTSPDLSAFGVPAGRAAINRDRGKRSLLEMEIVEAAKAHLIEHPIRTDETDRQLMHVIGECIASATERTSQGMTPTEQRRAAKLAARHARRNQQQQRQPQKRKHR